MKKFFFILQSGVAGRHCQLSPW